MFEIAVRNVFVGRRQYLAVHHGRQRRRSQDAAREAQAAHERLDILARGEVVGDEHGGILRIGTAQLHRPARGGAERSEEHTSELQSLMRISYAVVCLKKKTDNTKK